MNTPRHGRWSAVAALGLGLLLTLGCSDEPDGPSGLEDSGGAADSGATDTGAYPSGRPRRCATR